MRSAVIGAGPVGAGFVVSTLWACVVTRGGESGIAAGASWFADTWLMLALPCAAIAWALAAWSLHLTKGMALASRRFSLVLWGAATPGLYGLAAMVWVGVASGDWTGGGLFWMGCICVGTIIWCATLTPVFVALIATPLLRADPATAPASLGQPAVYGRDERDEDVEVGLAGVRASLGELLRRDA